MVVLGIAAAVIAVTLVVLVCFMIPAFVEVRKTAAATREFLSCVEKEIKPVLLDMHEMLTDLKVISVEAATKAEDVKIFMEELGNAGRNIRTINTLVSGITGFVVKSSMWATGAKVAGKLIAERILKKRG
jgi:uncharacterized protein YoxC